MGGFGVFGVAGEQLGEQCRGFICRTEFCQGAGGVVVIFHKMRMFGMGFAEVAREVDDAAVFLRFGGELHQRQDVVDRDVCRVEGSEFSSNQAVALAVATGGSFQETAAQGRLRVKRVETGISGEVGGDVVSRSSPGREDGDGFVRRTAADAGIGFRLGAGEGLLGVHVHAAGVSLLEEGEVSRWLMAGRRR